MLCMWSKSFFVPQFDGLCDQSAGRRRFQTTDQPTSDAVSNSRSPFEISAETALIISSDNDPLMLAAASILPAYFRRFPHKILWKSEGRGANPTLTSPLQLQYGYSAKSVLSMSSFRTVELIQH
ncbi:hypothetical protein RRG08_019796 [Elysia crispata]|uniref:Uncharacterized protein n=1 Tax=Elysia crispata TaxID=231223 RepID=A0AAE1E5J1_9GAST|nr:hypothetical protein RRG08_019796 [Elysia crispata]